MGSQCQLTFAAILWVKTPREMFVTVTALEYALLLSQ